MRPVVFATVIAAVAAVSACQSQANNPPVRCSDPGATCDLERAPGSRGAND